ncbi:hypothetical protein THRCLA_20706 [Thraustotheca clavata]|uniref:SET domain-containing protein n=1 Tax=Thraustotheca clavata TaxID=74557 RepID=A0A1W0A4C9_9STRA|nr:hypothetical protein THRCLA_20706 [Thraustotheca clavata]
MVIHCLDQGDPPQVHGTIAFNGSHVSYDDAGIQMQCIYTPHLLFQSSLELRNYSFWGFTTGSEFPQLSSEEAAMVDHGEIHASVEIQPIAIPNLERQLGLFATESIPKDILIGEYTGVVQVDRGCGFDSYGLAYPSVYQEGNMVVSANEYGNAIRCVNHSFEKFNCRFISVLYQGRLHMICKTVKEVASGEQLLVNYGKSYWKESGVIPFEW